MLRAIDDMHDSQWEVLQPAGDSHRLILAIYQQKVQHIPVDSIRYAAMQCHNKPTDSNKVITFLRKADIETWNISIK